MYQIISVKSRGMFDFVLIIFSNPYAVNLYHFNIVWSLGLRDDIEDMVDDVHIFTLGY
jgi:hypothetical protein